jgi:ketosteroid isomerase-like protein
MESGTALRWLFLCILLFQVLAGCGKSDPEDALLSSEKELIAALEARDTKRALDLLHPDFVARAPDHDRDWARRMMTVMFNRHQKISVMALTSKRHIHPNAPDRATGEGEIAVVGADNILPEAANRFQVRLGWVRVGKQWKLLSLDWSGEGGE